MAGKLIKSYILFTVKHKKETYMSRYKGTNARTPYYFEVLRYS